MKGSERFSTGRRLLLVFTTLVRTVPLSMFKVRCMWGVRRNAVGWGWGKGEPSKCLKETVHLQHEFRTDIAVLYGFYHMPRYPFNIST